MSAYYRPVGDECLVFEHAYSQRLPVLLKGPTGSGKSRFVEAMAEKLKRELISVSCHDETSAVDLVGRYLVQGGNTVWQDGPVTRAVRGGAILYLDEIAEARPDVVVVIHPLSDHRRRLFVEARNEEIVAHEHFSLVVSFNPGYQRGLKELKPSTRQRFVGISFRHPSQDVEAEILAVEGGVEPKLAAKLASLGKKLRALEGLGLSELPSTRLLVDAARLFSSGLAIRKACHAAIAEPLTDDPDVLAALDDVISLSF